MLLLPSIEGLQQLMHVCEIAINSLGLQLNYKQIGLHACGLASLGRL